MSTRYRILGQRVPAAATWEDAYVVPEGVDAVVSSLTVSNDSALTTDFSIAVVPSGESVGQVNLIYSEIPIPHPETFIATVGITMTEGDRVMVRSTAGDVAFSVFGSERSFS